MTEPEIHKLARRIYKVVEAKFQGHHGLAASIDRANLSDDIEQEICNALFGKVINPLETGTEIHTEIDDGCLRPKFAKLD